MIAEGCYAKIWKVDAHEKYTEVQLSTSNKEKEVDFSGYARLVGKSHTKATEACLKNGDSIKIHNFGVTNNYVKKTNRSYTNIIIFDCDVVQRKSRPGEMGQQVATDANSFNIDNLGTDLPFN